MTIRELIQDAYTELGIVAEGETMSAAQADRGLRLFNRLLDLWNGQRCAVYADQFLTFPLTPSLSPHTIGPSGTFVVSQRPESIEDCNLILSGSTPSKVPISIRDAQWYADVPTPSIATTTPTDVYFEKAWPNGKLFFYPVPTFPYSVEFLVRVVLAAVTLNDTFSFPPGYQAALTLTEAEALAGANGLPVPAKVAEDARDARAIVFGNNDETPRLISDLPSMSSRARSTWNYRTGS